MYSQLSSVLFFFLMATTSEGLMAGTSRKELRTKEVNQDAIIQLSRPQQSNIVDPSRVRQLSWRPRVFLYEGFLTEEECDRLIQGDDDVAARINERLSAWSFIPKENGRSLQVLQFELEDEKKQHSYFANVSSLQLSEPLMATVILYLSNVSRGGQILFPKSENKAWSDCSKSSEILRPTKGNAILFFNLHLNATPDDSSWHARCPILHGEMWCATKIFLMRPAVSSEMEFLQSTDTGCSDEDENCPRWAAIGECQRNPIFMIGSPDYFGTCRKSCNAC